MTEKLKKFCKNYEAEVRESTSRHCRPSRLSLKLSKYDSDEHVSYEEIKCVEVRLPEDRFRALMEHDEWLQRARDNRYSKADEGICIAKQHEREARIRHENPAVRIAYQKYQTLLNLVDSHYD